MKRPAKVGTLCAKAYELWRVSSINMIETKVPLVNQDMQQNKRVADIRVVLWSSRIPVDRGRRV